MISLLFVAFLAGVATIAAPCVLPILPVVLSAGATGGKRRPLGTAAGLVVSFGSAVLVLALLVQKLAIPTETFRWLSAAILFFFGLVLVIPAFGGWIEQGISRVARRFAPDTSVERSGFWSGFMLGISLGLVWTPCAGPILAIVVTQAANAQITGEVVLISFIYALGAGVPLFLIATLGQRLRQMLLVAKRNMVKIQQIFGTIILLQAFLIVTGLDTRIQTQILRYVPSFVAEGLTTSLERRALESREGAKQGVSTSSMGLQLLGRAPELVGTQEWIGSEPLTLAGLRQENKVVLVDFWTYSCINCQRTIPHLNNLYEKYKDHGLVIIGVHAPEFVFEKDLSNLKRAVTDAKIMYPVVQDNDFATWRAYENQYWPAHYLIDTSGEIRQVHFGEGAYAETEHAVRQLLGLDPMAIDTKEESSTARRTPETYFGSWRSERVGEVGKLRVDEWAIAGNWKDESQYIVTADATSATLSMRVRASDMYLVVSGKGEAMVRVNGEVKYRGVDVADDGRLLVEKDAMYHLVAGASVNEPYLVEITTTSPGLAFYAATFGS